MSKATTHIETEKQLVPSLRFKEFEGDWGKTKLGDIGKVSMCKRILKDQTSPNGDIPFYKIGTFGKQADAFIEKEIYQEYKTKYSYPRKGDVLIAASGATYGKTVVFDGEPAFFQDSNIVWIDNDETKVNNTFLNINYQFIKWAIQTSTIPRLYNDIIRNSSINTPDLPEQQKIASFLSAVDEKIQQLTRKKELLELYKKGVMQQLFSGKLRFKPDPSKASGEENGKAFPKWEEKRLGEYLIYKSERNESKQVELVLSVSNKKGFITQDEQFDGYAVASKDLSNYKVVYKNDIAYNPSRINVGSIARLNNFEKGIVSPMYIVFALKDELDSVFFENQYATHRFKHLIKVGCSGSVRDSLNFEDLANFKFKFPSIQEQKKIANYLSNIDSKIENVTNQINQNQTFKKGLLQQMFV